MSLVDLTIREADLDALRALVRREDGTEAAAYVLCGECRIQSDPWERRSRRPALTDQPLHMLDYLKRSGVNNICGYPPRPPYPQRG